MSNDNLTLKTSSLLFQGQNFRNCGPSKTFFCPEMEEVNDLIEYTYKYKEVYTTNTKFEVTNLDDNFEEFVDQVVKILGKHLTHISVYNRHENLHEVLYNPLNTPKGRIPKASILNKSWQDITMAEYKLADAKTRSKILEKYIHNFKEEKYCRLVKATQLDYVHAELYNKIMHSYIQANMTPCIPIANYIIDPKLLKYYPEHDRLLYITKHYANLDNPNTFLKQLGADKIPAHVLKYWDKNHPGDFINIAWDSMTPTKFNQELNPELCMNYLTKHSKYQSTPKWEELLKSIKTRRKHSTVTNRKNSTTTNRKQQRPIKFDELLNQVTVIDKPWSSLTEDDFKNVSEKTRHALLEKHIQHFKDEEYCTLLGYSNPTMMNTKLFTKITAPYIKAGIQPCIDITEYPNQN